MSWSNTGVTRGDIRSSGYSSHVFRVHVGGMVHVIMVHVILGKFVACGYLPGPQLFIGLRI